MTTDKSKANENSNKRERRPIISIYSGKLSKRLPRFCFGNYRGSEV